MPRKRLQKQNFAIHQDVAQAAKDVLPVKDNTPLLNDDNTTAIRTLTPASTGSINSMQTASRNIAVAKHAALGRTATIRSVPSFDSGSESHSPDNKQGGSPFSSSTNSNTSAGSTAFDQGTPKSSTQQHRSLGGGRNEASSTETTTTTATPNRWSANGVRVVESQQQLPHDSSVLSDNTDTENGTAGGHWDSTIGKAGLGKTGRVINKLVSDNDGLKREIQIERLRAEEAKQAAKLLEDKMERMMGDYEGRLLEANVTKTLLARKERQVESLTTALDIERKKTLAALDSERVWKSEMQKVRADTKTQVEQATTQAALMEGRYNAIASHWREQGDQVGRAVAKMRGEIAEIVDERAKDDDRIQTLRELCDQQDSNIKGLQREKEDMAALFARYKQTQDDDLRDIKTNAKRREEEQERMLTEAREALHKLKWALNVKNNVKDAQ